MTIKQNITYFKTYETRKPSKLSWLFLVLSIILGVIIPLGMLSNIRIDSSSMLLDRYWPIITGGGFLVFIILAIYFLVQSFKGVVTMG